MASRTPQPGDFGIINPDGEPATTADIPLMVDAGWQTEPLTTPGAAEE